MAHHLGFIGGSGFYEIESLKKIKIHDLSTPFGSPSAPVTEYSYEGKSLYFLPRHGPEHSISPSEINYRANIFAMKTLGVKTLVSLCAVGSLKEELSPRMIVLPDQFIDWTKGQRKRTFFGEGVVGHVSCAYPVEKALIQRIEKACLQAEINHAAKGTYLCIEGPQFSSKAESNLYRSFGADIIGMTNVPEAYLAKEAAMAYGSVATVTDYDCWREEHCHVEEILMVLKENYRTAQKLISLLIPDLCDRPIEFTPENRSSVITRPQHISSHQREIIDILLR
ncbi:MAG: S-methyl-5'-thioadenosine phosphorylase [Bacteriovoracales bacterium]|nr:S-methyl-5'-thioadenosine phosphorylase [Bacteriovoracales bacterium]